MTADGAYDAEAVYDAVAERHPNAAVIIPPRATSVAVETTTIQRDRHLAVIDVHGRMGDPAQGSARMSAWNGSGGWQRRSGYSQRNLVETAMFRYKTIISRRLSGPDLVQSRRPRQISGATCSTEWRGSPCRPPPRSTDTHAGPGDATSGRPMHQGATRGAPSFVLAEIAICSHHAQSSLQIIRRERALCPQACSNLLVCVSEQRSARTIGVGCRDCSARISFAARCTGSPRWTGTSKVSQISHRRSKGRSDPPSSHCRQVLRHRATSPFLVLQQAAGTLVQPECVVGLVAELVSQSQYSVSTRRQSD
jgi:hypothetical protein